MRDRSNHYDRRSVLKSAGIAASSLAGIGVVSGRSGSPDRVPSGVYHSLLRRRKKKGWDVNRWRTELAERGYDFMYSDSRVTVSTGGFGSLDAATSDDVTVTVAKLPPVDERQEGVETSHAKEGTAKLKLTYTRGYPDRINYSWSADDPWLSGVSPPVDFATLSFEHDDYDWQGGDVEFGPWASPSEVVEASAATFRNGRYEAASHSDRTVSRFGSWMDKGLEPTSGTTSTRKIYADYVCRWNDVEVTGVSVGSAGASILFSESTGFWRAETNASEEEMDDGSTYVDDDPL